MDIYRFCYEIQHILSPIGLIDLKFTECTYGGMKNIHTKFEVILRKLNFAQNYGILANLS